jgi:hypothetical protein
MKNTSGYTIERNLQIVEAFSKLLKREIDTYVDVRRF